jgi:tripartite-type tricarboxylate transporter receptor subunit TctC
MLADKLARFALAACALCAAAAPHALAQTTRIVVPGPPGGFADITVRLASERLQQGLGTVVIEHRPGAGGTVGLEYLRNTAPDGATIGMINLSAAANESIVKGKSFELLRDFEPVGQYAWLANVLIVNASLGADKVAALLDALRKQGQANYSSGGVGSPGHLTGELFRMRTKLALTHVPYKGAPPAVTAVVAGEVALMFATASSAIGQVRGGKLRALAVTTSERLRQLPDVPTLAEAGLGDINVTDWVGLVVPKGTPPEARERIHRAFSAAFADAEVQDKLRNATILPLAKPLGPAEFGAFLRSEIDKWAKVVREAGISQN